jgi:hypothetical protein
MAARACAPGPGPAPRWGRACRRRRAISTAAPHPLRRAARRRAAGPARRRRPVGPRCTQASATRCIEDRRSARLSLTRQLRAEAPHSACFLVLRLSALIEIGLLCTRLPVTRDCTPAETLASRSPARLAHPGGLLEFSHTVTGRESCARGLPAPQRGRQAQGTRRPAAPLRVRRELGVAPQPSRRAGRGDADAATERHGIVPRTIGMLDHESSRRLLGCPRHAVTIPAEWSSLPIAMRWLGPARSTWPNSISHAL